MSNELSFLFVGIALSSDDVYKELSVIKDKWRSIANSLKIPDELLDKLEGIDDPLLEVIIHWLKGASDRSPAWDIVVSSLSDPCVSEAELADKIHRLYCHDETATSEVQDYSGTTAKQASIVILLPNYYCM